MSKMKKWKKLIGIFLVVSLILGDIRPFLAAQKSIQFPSLTTMIYVQSGGDTGVTQLGESQYMIANNSEATITISMQSQNLNGSDKLREVYAGVQLGYIQDGTPDLDPEVDHGIGSVSARIIENNDTWIDARYKETNPDSEELFDNNLRYTDYILVKYKGETLQSSTSAKVYSFDLKVRFDTGTKENAIINLKSFAKYKGYIHNGNDYTLDTPDEPNKWFESVETNKSTVQLINSNLKWTSKLTPVSGKKADDTAPALWKKYNYQDMIAEIENISESDEPYMDEFEFVFKFPYSYGINGVVDAHMIEWLYNPNGDPIKNESDEIQEKSKYIGKLNEGGVLIYDVTDLSDEDITSLLKSREPKIKSIPYIYTGQGIVSVLMGKDRGGKLYSPTLVTKDPANRYSKRRLLIRVPIGNNLTFPTGSQYTMVSTKMIPTVRFGHASATVSLSNKGQSIVQYFKRPTTGGTIAKVAQSEPFYIGKPGYYTISKATNTANYPAFHPYIEDTLPNHFDLTEIRYILTKDEISSMKQEYGDEILDKIFDKETPFQMAFRNEENEIEWKTVGTWIKEPTEDGIIWKITGIDSLAVDKNFTKQIRLNFDYEFDPLELYSIERNSAIRGNIQVWGIPRKAITLQNKASVYWDYWIYHELNQLTHGWNHKVYGPYSTTADKGVTPPSLWCATQGLYDDGEERRESDIEIGVANTIVNGYTVRFGDSNNSTLYGGRVRMDIPVLSKNQEEYVGFDTESILIKKELVAKAPIRSIQIDWYSGRSSTYALNHWKRDESGNYILSKKDFATYQKMVMDEETKKTELKSFPEIPIRVTLLLQEVKSNTKKSIPLTDDEAYIQFLGNYLYPGILTLNTYFDSNYQDGEQREVSCSSFGKLEFKQPKLYPLVHGVFQNGKSEEYKEDVTVSGLLNKPYAGYRFYAKVGETDLMPGYMKLATPTGFLTNAVRISPDFTSNLIDSKTGQRTWKKFEVVGTKGSVITYSKEELEKLYNEETGIFITKEDLENYEEVIDTNGTTKKVWKAGEEVAEICIYFRVFHVGENHVGYIGVDGTATRVLSNIALGTISTDFPKDTNLVLSEQARGIISINQPNLQILVQSFSEDGNRTVGKKVSGVKYEELVGYTYRIGSANETRIEPGYLHMTLPIMTKEEEKELIDKNYGRLPSTIPKDFLENPRFVASEIVLKKEMLSEMKFSKVVIQSTTGDTTTLTAKELGVEWKPEDNSDYMNVEQDIVIPSTKWIGKARYVSVYFDYYKEHKTIKVPVDENNVPIQTDIDQSYVQIRGSGQKEGTLESVGKVASAMPSGNVEKTDQAELNFPLPVLKSEMYSVFDNKKQRIEDVDLVKGTLNRPYAGYRYFVASHDIGLVPGIIDYTLPSAYKADTLYLSKDLLENLEDRNGRLSITQFVLSTSSGTIHLDTEQLIQLQKAGKGDISLKLDPNTINPLRVRNSSIEWQENTRLSAIQISFRILKKTEKDVWAGSIETYGTITAIGTFYAYGRLRFPTDPRDPKKYPLINSAADAAIQIVNIKPWIDVYAFREETADTRNEDKTVEAGKYEPYTGYTFRFGSDSPTRMEPGYLSIELPKSEANVPYFGTKELRVTKELLSNMKLNKIQIVSFDGKTTDLYMQSNGEVKDPKKQYLNLIWNPIDGDEYMNFEQDLLLSSTQWEGTAKHIYFYFDYYKENTKRPVSPETPLDNPAYVQIMGEPYKEGLLRATGVVGNGSVLLNSTYATDYAELKIERPILEVKAESHNIKTKKGIQPKYDIVEQHGKEIKIPIDWDTYYTYEIKTTSKYSSIKDARVVMSLNNKIRETDDKAHGFLPKRLVIPKNYKDFFQAGQENGIVKIVVKETVKPKENPPEVSFTVDDLQVDEEGNFYLPDTKWKDSIEYPSEFVVYLHGIPVKTKESDSLVFTLNGMTDWYTYKDDYETETETIWERKAENKESRWIKLNTTLLFETYKELDVNSKSDSARQDVPIPKVCLSADFNPYYEHSQGEEVMLKEWLETYKNGIEWPLSYSQGSALSQGRSYWNKIYSESLETAKAYRSVDNARSYLAVPYEKNVTERFSLFQESISKADEFEAKITLPIRSKSERIEPNRGFHALSMRIEKEIWNETYFKKGIIYLKDINNPEWEIKLKPVDLSGVFTVEKIGADGGSTIETFANISVDQKGDLVLYRKQWEGWGMTSLWEIYIYGEDFDTRDEKEAGDIFIIGFSDADFTTSSSVPNVSSGGINDITKTKADTYLRSQKHKKRSKKIFLRIMDEARLFVSKMYFDVQVETGYIRKEDAEKDPSLRYKQTGISREHIRYGSIPSGYFQDEGELEVGYKSLVSIGVDFRQYLNDYVIGKPHMPNDIPNGHHTTNPETNTYGDYASIQMETDGNSKYYVKSYAYNTKADLEIKVELPVEQGYEPYYLKIDPRAVKDANTDSSYIDSITFIKKDGTTEVIAGNELTLNSTRWDVEATGEKNWYRINLLDLSKEKRFLTVPSYKGVKETIPYYRNPDEKMVESTAIKEVIFKIKFNQKETDDGVHAKLPDYATWVQDTKDMAEQHMFEFVGRVNKTGLLKPKATATLTTGERVVSESSSETNPQRKTVPVIENTEPGGYRTYKKCSWSLQNYYNYYMWNYYYGGWSAYSRTYTAADIVSEAYIRVVANKMATGSQEIIVSDKTDKKAEQRGTSRTDYIFGTNHPYIMKFHTYDSGKLERYVSYLDKAWTESEFPPLSIDGDGEYWGFKPNQFLVKKDLLDHAQSLTFTIDKKDAIGQVISTRKVEFTKDTIQNQQIVDPKGNPLDSGDYYLVEIKYPEEVASRQGTAIQLQKDDTGQEYVTKVAFLVSGLAGDGDYASETYGREKDTYFDTLKNKDLFYLYGDVNILNGDEKNDKLKDGINRHSVEWRNDDGSGSKSIWNATMKAFMIPLTVSSTLTSEKVSMWDYELTKNSNGTDVAVLPMVSRWKLNFKNEGTSGTTSAGESYTHANITHFGFTQPLSRGFRLQKIQVPKVLFGQLENDATTFTDDGISKITEFMLNDGKKDINVLSYFVEQEIGGKQYYVLDVTKLFRDKVLSANVYHYPNGTYVAGNVLDKEIPYIANRVASFKASYVIKPKEVDGEIKYLEANTELFTEDDLLFEGIWVDQTEEAVINNEDYNEYNSTPTCGKYSYSRNSTYIPDGDHYYSIEYMSARSDFTVGTATFGSQSQSIKKNNGVNQRVYNRISEFSYGQQRGTVVQIRDKEGKVVDRVSLAYDVDRNDKNWNTIPVNNRNLYSGDQIDYKLTFSVPKTSKITPAPIPIKNPKMKFVAPKGTRIIGWKFVEGTEDLQQVGENEQIVSGSALKVFAYETEQDKSIEFEAEQEYRTHLDGTISNYKTLEIQSNGERYVPVGGSFSIIIYIEMYQEKGSATSVTETVLMGAEHRHNYMDHEVLTGTTNDMPTLGNGGTAILKELLFGKQMCRSVEITSSLTYGGALATPTVKLEYQNLENEELDQQEMTLTIENIRNTTGHFQDTMEYKLDLTKVLPSKERKTYFQIATRPAITWNGSNVSMFYQTKETYGTDVWEELSHIELEDKEKEVELLRNIYQLKWVYENVPAYLNDDGSTQVVMDKILIEGIANFQEERTNIETELAKEYVNMPVFVIGAGTHIHEEIAELITKKYCSNSTSRDVHRRKPKVSMNIQLLNTSDVTRLDELAPMTTYQYAYYPGAEYLYRLTVENEKSPIQVIKNTSGTKTGVINAGTGSLLSPVVYDKIPTEYMDVVSPFDIYVVDTEMKKAGKTSEEYRRQLSKQEVNTVVSMCAISAKDIGGSYYTDFGITKTYRPVTSGAIQEEIEYTMYQFDFGKIDLDLQRGERLEIVYRVKIHDGNLPIAKNSLTNRSVYSGRINSTGSHSTELLVGDDLIHEMALTAKRNPWLDPLEFLNGTKTSIPNSGNSSQEVVVGMTNREGSQINNYQKISNDTKYANDYYNNNRHNSGTVFGNTLSNIGYYISYVKPRVEDTTNFATWNETAKQLLQEKEGRNLVWSQHKVHMRKGWLSGATEIVNGKEDYYYQIGKDISRYTFGDRRYSTIDYYYDDYPFMDEKIPTVEWKDEIITRLYANNYGDSSINGVEMTYVFPKGIRPQLDKFDQIKLRYYDRTTRIRNGQGYSYSYYYYTSEFKEMSPVDGFEDGTGKWLEVENPKISYEVLQNPQMDKKTTPSYQLVNIRRNPDGDRRYTEEEIDGSWVVKFTVKNGLSPYWGGYSRYAYALDIPSYVYETTENGEYYDRLYIAPIDSKSNSYCQIYDTGYEVGKTYGSLGEQFDIDMGGPEGIYYSKYKYQSNLSDPSMLPPGLYINGYNAHSNRVTSSIDTNILEEYNKEFEDLTTKRQYAQVGSSAKVKKPYLRLWPDIGIRDKNGAIGKHNFIFEEEELDKPITVSVNVENRFYASEYFTTSEKDLSYQLEDGGARGTLFDPVITMVLPYGLVPVNADGDIMLGDKLNSTLSWSMLKEQWNDTTKQYEPMEQMLIDRQNLTENAFDTKVEFDAVSKQYIIRFLPKGNSHDMVVMLRNRQMARISLEVVSYDYYKNSPIKSQYQNDAIQVYLGSRQERFWYTSDSRLSTKKQPYNRYKVLSPKTSNDYRYDSKIDKYTGAYPTITQEEYTEVEFIKKNPVPMFIQNKEDISFADINTNKKEKIHWEYSYGNIEEDDSFLVNSVRMFPIISQLRTDAKISTEKKGGEVVWMSESTPNLATPLNYSDNLWYTITFSNMDLAGADVRRTGMIKHATFVSQIYLPQELRYDDTYEDEKDDKYAEYYVEMTDERGKTVEYTPLELEQIGFRVQIKAIGFDQKGRQIVRALLVPAGDDIGRVAGQLRYKESITLHFKTRVAEMDPIDTRQMWTVNTNTEIFSSIYGLDGATLDFLTLEATEKAPFKKQDIDFIEIGSRKEVTPIPNAPKEGEEYFIDNEKYSYDKTVGFSIIQPRYAFVRTNTERVRRVFESDPITGDIPSRDAVFRQGSMQKLLINQAGLKTGALQQFVVQYDIPYRSRLEMRPDRADKSGLPIDIDIARVSTGVWEVPEDARQKQELEENLRVYIYIRTGSDEEEYEYYDKTDLDLSDSNWILVNKDGADIHTNTYVSLKRYANVKQILWVVRHREDPIHYPVPKGFRLNIDASSVLAGKQEVTDVDPIDPDLKEALHKDDFVQNVIDHSMEVGIYVTTKEEITKSQWLNYYVSLGSMYTDTKKAPNSEQTYRTGYEIVPELPYMDLFLETKYLKRLSSGNYSWSDNLLYDLEESKIVKHKVILFNADDITMRKFDVDGEEDSVSNPEIMVALPLREHLAKENMKYIPFKKLRKDTQEEPSVQRFHLFGMNDVANQRGIILSPSAIQLFDRTREVETINPPSLVPTIDSEEEKIQSTESAKTTISDTVLDESYIGQYPELDPNFKFYWTAYAMKVDTGELLPLDDAIEPDPESVSVRLLDDVDTRIAYIGDNVDRVMLSFRFGGKLLPGYTLVVDYLSKVEDVVRPPNAADFQIKAWVTKEGTFLPSLLPKECIRLIQPDSYTPTNVGIRGDEYDFNQNSDQNELLLEVVERSGEIKGKRELILQKYVSTELNKMDKASEDPIGVSQGSKYTFTLACQSANAQEKIDYVAPIIFDILPYEGDESMIGSSVNGSIQAKPRESTWSGWFIPESVKLWTNTRLNKNDPALTEKVVEPSEYDIFVGPIKKVNGKFVLQYNENGKPKLPSVTERTSSKFYASINVHGANSPYLENFVTLKELMAAKETQEDYDSVVKGIQMLLLRFKNPLDAILYGQGSYHLEYSMIAPLNLPSWIGEWNSNGLKDYPSWNTMATAAYQYDPALVLKDDMIGYTIQESNRSGVFVQDPIRRGYIGDYVWYDYNGNGQQDEGYYDRLVDGKRQIFSEAAIDINHDGTIDKEDDPGVDKVKVELLTKNGYPSNIDGQAVVKAKKGAANYDIYYVLDDETGEYMRNASGVRITTNRGPEITYTTRDYYDSKGYYIFANLKPSEYRLRFTLPTEYNNYVLTTPKVAGKDVDIYKKGSQLPILNVPKNSSDLALDTMEGNGTTVTSPTFVTSPIYVEAVDLENEIEYDKKAMMTDIGIGKAVRYTGTVWNDNLPSAKEEQKFNGWRDEISSNKKEDGISSIVINAYEKGKEEVAIGMDGKPITTMTDSNGNYTIDNLYPGKEYIFRIDNPSDRKTEYKASIVPNPNTPLKEVGDNDGVGKVREDGSYYIETGSFKADYVYDDKGQIQFDQDGSTTANTKVDFGLVKLEANTGVIGDCVWVDINRNGICDENESSYIGALQIDLKPYYYDTNVHEWKELKNTTLNSKIPTSVTSDQNGAYLFKNLPSIYDDGINKYIIGYEVSVPNLPDEYTYTLLKKGQNGETDNRLGNDGYLVGDLEVDDGRYLILATDIGTPTELNASILEVTFGTGDNQVTKYYSSMQSDFRMDYDIGLIKINRGGVSGVVFEDVDRDGLQNPEVDKAVSGAAVYLEMLVDNEIVMTQHSYTENTEKTPFYHVVSIDQDYMLQTDKVAGMKENQQYIEPMITEGGSWKIARDPDTGKEYSVVTGEDGKYEFNNVPLYTVINGVKKPIIYRVCIDKPINTQLTFLQEGMDRTKDSDFGIDGNGNYIKDVISHSFVLGKEQEKADYWDTKYDYMTEVFLGHLDAGFISLPIQVEIGDRVWNDLNNNGIQDMEEYGIQGMKVTLYRFNPRIETETYILNEQNEAVGVQTVRGKWEPCVDDKKRVVTTKTNIKGNYHFIVPAYDTDPKSEYYMQPYHYRAAIEYYGTGTISPLHSTFIDGKEQDKAFVKTMDSNGFQCENLIDITIKPEEKDEIENWFATKNNSKLNVPMIQSKRIETEILTPSAIQEKSTTQDKENVAHNTDISKEKEGGQLWSPPKFEGIPVDKTPVGNLFGIVGNKMQIISDEFQIADGYEETDYEIGKSLVGDDIEFIPIDKMLILHNIEKKRQAGIKSSIVGEAMVKVLESTIRYFEEKDEIVDSVVSGSAIMIQDAKEVKGPLVSPIFHIQTGSSIYVDIHAIYSDYSIDFGIYDKELPDPEPKPEEPSPEAPRPEVPQPEEPSPEEPKPEVPQPEEPNPETPPSEEEPSVDETPKEEEKAPDVEKEKNPDKNKDKNPNKDKGKNPSKNNDVSKNKKTNKKKDTVPNHQEEEEHDNKSIYLTGKKYLDDEEQNSNTTITFIPNHQNSQWGKNGTYQIVQTNDTSLIFYHWVLTIMSSSIMISFLLLIKRKRRKKGEQ